MPSPSSPARTVLLLARQLTIGGAERQLFLLATGLDQRRFRPVVVSLGDGHVEHWGDELRRAGVDVHKIRPGPVLRRLAALRQVIDVVRPDVIHAFHFHAATHAILASAGRRVPIIAGLRSHPTPEYLPPTLWQRIALERIVACVSNSRASARDMSHRFPRVPAVSFVPNGLIIPADEELEVRRAHARRVWNVSDQTLLLGFVGRLVVAKQVDVFLRAVAALSREHPQVRAVVVGDGPAAPALRALAEGIAGESVITFTGERTDARELMAGLDVLCLPSRTEGMANVLLEAAAVAVPVVASAVGGSAEVVLEGRTGWLVPSGDVLALQDRVARLSSDPGLRLRMGQAARLHARATFGHRRMADAYSQMYDGILAGNASAQMRGWRCFARSPHGTANVAVGHQGT